MRSWRAVGRSSGRAAALVAALAVSVACRLAAQDSLPIGFGTLRRDDITVRFATGQVEIQTLPLDEDVIRLLAPDTYRALTGLLQSRRAGIDSAAARAGLTRPTLVLVTFYGVAPQARFVPEDLDITNRGRLYRPVAIVPLSPAWATLQLAARQQAAAIYLYDEGISWRESATLSYQGLDNDAWSRSLTLLERERARVMARAAAQPSP
ncbi:MAG TPA: hypothetical protein VNI61_05870 [Gemmatimonadales bacterium]|nr:hypothetical protein [Gemmatimonadales bacterium]